jgi:hypothetical protein
MILGGLWRKKRGKGALLQCTAGGAACAVAVSRLATVVAFLVPGRVAAHVDMLAKVLASWRHRPRGLAFKYRAASRPSLFFSLCSPPMSSTGRQNSPLPIHLHPIVRVSKFTTSLHSLLHRLRRLSPSELAARTVDAAAARHGLWNLLAVASFLRASSAQAGHTLAFPSLHCISRASQITTATGVSPAAAAAGTSATWPDGHGPPLVKLRQLEDAYEPQDASPPLPRHRRASTGRNWASSCVLCSSFTTRDLARQ